MKTNTLSLILIPLLISSSASPTSQAISPPPDGGYPRGNTAEGQNALFSLTTGGYNTAVGFFSLRAAVIGNFNTGVGAGSLLSNTADNNTAVGAGALSSNSAGMANTASGTVALFSNINGGENTANGAFALFSNTSGAANTAIGFGALTSNIQGTSNTAIGINALAFNSAGNSNTAGGSFALDSNVNGENNTAFGVNALFHNTDGNDNTAIGESALPENTAGSQNTALGRRAGSDVTTANNVICIGANVTGANVDDSCFIGNIRNALVAPDAAPVLIDSAGKLGTTSGSSRRFKTQIKPINKASEAILALHPVIFRYTSDRAGTIQFGLIAEEVADVNPDLVMRDKEGKPYSVRYDAVNTMLLNEFLKEHEKAEEQQATIAELKSAVAEQETRLAKQGEHIAALDVLISSAPMSTL